VRQLSRKNPWTNSDQAKRRNLLALWVLSVSVLCNHGHAAQGDGNDMSDGTPKTEVQILRKGLENARDVVRYQVQQDTGGERRYWMDRLLEVNKFLEHADHARDGQKSDEKTETKVNHL